MTCAHWCRTSSNDCVDLVSAGITRLCSAQRAVSSKTWQLLHPETVLSMGAYTVTLIDGNRSVYNTVQHCYDAAHGVRILMPCRCPDTMSCIRGCRT